MFWLDKGQPFKSELISFLKSGLKLKETSKLSSCLGWSYFNENLYQISLLCFINLFILNMVRVLYTCRNTMLCADEFYFSWSMNVHNFKAIRKLLCIICWNMYILCIFLSVKFMFSKKATKNEEIFTILLSVCTVNKSKVEISQNFVAFSEYTNFNNLFSIFHDCNNSF